MIKLTASGSFKNTEAFLQRMKNQEHLLGLDRFGSIGVSALKSATPVDSSETANSWDYTIIKKKNFYSIVWRNTHIDKGAQVAILIQYGHGTGTGGYVQGRDYINPAIRPIFDQILADMWKVVTN